MPLLLHHDVVRPAPAPVRHLPFGVWGTGHYKIQPPFISHDKIIHFIHLFWCVRGAGIIEIDGRPHALKKHQLAVYYPNMRHYWYADRQCWEFYWLVIDGPFATFLPAAFGLEAGVYDAGPAPLELFNTLGRLAGQPSKQAEIKACTTAFAILARAMGSHADQADELVNMSVEHMHKDYTSPELNIKTLAASLGVRYPVFYTRFNAAMGMPPGAYLNRLRIQKALSLLQHTHLTVAKIAGQCGYRDANYFSRIIRRATGRSPSQFREAGMTGK